MWAGFRFFGRPPADRPDRKKEIQEAVQRLTDTYRPDFVLFQEVVRYNREGTREGASELIVPPEGYFYRSYIAINTRRQNHPAKWDPIRAKGAGNWPVHAYLGQGNGILWRKEIPTAPSGTISEKQPIPIPALRRRQFGWIRASLRATGTRKPRLAVVAHFVHTPTGRDIFIVNLHMTTLKGEREGFPEKDDRGSKVRLNQVGIVLNGIVSRYNEWREQQGKTRSDERAIWILAGDLNATPESDELTKIRRMNFMDLCGDAKGTGTKRSKYDHQASITVDYIFAGPQYFAFDPHLVRQKLTELRQNSPHLPYGPVYAASIEKVSDHYPVLARFPSPDVSATLFF